MAAIKKTIKIHGDENITENIQKKLIQINKNNKKIVNVRDQQTKRTALGELGNREVPVLDKCKDAALKDKVFHDRNAFLRNAKPRVDTHWKKTLISVHKTNPNIKTTATTNVTGGNKQPLISLASTSNINKNPTTIASLANQSKLKPNLIGVSKIKNEQLQRGEDSDGASSNKSLTRLRASIAKYNHKDVKLEKSDNKMNCKILEPTLTKIKEETKSEPVAHSELLINMIENIDLNDNDNMFMVPEYVNDIYSYLYDLENEFPIVNDYLSKQIEITPRMRSVLLDWINEVSVQFRLIPETYHMTVGIIDRYLQAIPTTKRQSLQLVGVTAIFIAAKYEELYPPEIENFVYITDDTYNKSQILDMEMTIMKALDFQLSRPIAITFLRRFSKAAKAEHEHHMCSKYILELVSIEYNFAHLKPSEVAAAALYLSLQLFNKKKQSPEKIWTKTLEYYSRYTVKHLKPIVIQIAKLVTDAHNLKRKAVFTKYESIKFDKISTRAELYGPIITKIINSAE